MLSYKNFFYSKIIFLLFYIIFLNYNLLSQKINSDFNQKNSLSSRTTGSFKVLAVMVQFKSDRDTLTTGDGTFDLSNKYRDSIIDAPPHDKQYFTSHLKFLKNYFFKVSDGKVNIEFFIPNKVYTLPDSMRRYGSSKSNDYSKLAELAIDTWKLVDNESPEIDFSQYDYFFIFHAGAGKDVDLASIYGADPTPYDLPSITFNLNSFKKYLNNNFDGISVRNGNFKITNTAILPEYEYREIKNYGTTTLVELSINGLIVSSFGSLLGLPDLFNTKTGATAIGRFGLMDGQSIFSYNGIFPPEPSAWEKVFLGWVNPITITSGDQVINISAHRTDGIQANSQIYKFPINSKEYFLVECRYRDPGNNGLKLKVENRGIEKVYNISQDTNGFNQFGNISLIDGVVTDVEDYDWSLPGGFDYKKNKLYGGILIWHIDENKIEKGLFDNTINNDLSHRGVDLEEADGSQDIGEEYGMLQSGANSENGTALDFWYNDLNYYSKDSLVRPVYKNIFSNFTNPNSRSYYGANSNITIYDFSEQGPNMSFKVRFGNQNVTPLNGFPVKLNLNTKDVTLANLNLINSNDNIFVIKVNDSIKFLTTNGEVAFVNSLSNIKSFAILKESNQSDKIVLVRNDNENYLEIYSIKDNSLIRNFNFKLTTSKNDSFFVYTLLSESNQDLRINVLNKSNGVLYRFYYKDEKCNLFRSDTINYLKPVSRIIGYENHMKINNLDYLSLSDNSIFANKTAFIKLNQDEEIKNIILNKNDILSSLYLTYLLHNRQEKKLFLKYIPIYKLNSSVNNNEISYPSNNLFSNVCDDCWNNVSEMSTGDIDNDNQSDFVFTIYNKLYVFSNNGVSLDNYPVTFGSSNANIKPILADVDGDSKNDIIVIAQNGNIYAYNYKGKLLDGYPVTIGLKPIITPIFFKVRDSIGLAVVDTGGYFYAYKLGGKYNTNKIAWSGNNANERMNGIQFEKNEIIVSKSNEYLPKSRAYNYPNPVYGNFTKIRYYLSENSNVKIRIFDLSGEKVKEFDVYGIGGMDNEVEWDVSKVQSGVYIAQIEAQSEKNKSSLTIKIAVIK